MYGVPIQVVNENTSNINWIEMVALYYKTIALPLYVAQIIMCVKLAPQLGRIDHKPLPGFCK